MLTLNQYLEIYIQIRHNNIVIEGHSDAAGGESYNQMLSVKRAQAVANVLAERGIPPSRIHVVGHDESQPIASNDTSEGRAQNRRVELILVPVTDRPLQLQ